MKIMDSSLSGLYDSYDSYPDEDDLMGEEDEDEYDDESEMIDNEYSMFSPDPDNEEYTEESIIVPTRAVDLKEMAAMNVAIALWNHLDVAQAVSIDIKRYSQSIGFSLYEKVNQWWSPDKLPVPPLISEQIGKYVSKMRNEIDDWVMYHHRKVFFYAKSSHSVYYHIYDIIWYPNGTINYKETARNLLKSMRISDVEKCHLLCTYCLKDDIERMSPQMFSNNLLDMVEFERQPLIYYWNCFYRKQLDKIPIGADAVNLSVDQFMVKCHYVDNWPAKEYFFDRLSSNDQVEMASWLIDKYGMKYLKLLLVKLDESQRLHLYSMEKLEKSVKIMSIFASARVYYEDILKTWSEIRNLITPSQFVTIFKTLFRMLKYDIVVKEIWTSARDDLKHHLLNSFDQYNILEKMLNAWISDTENDSFFIVMQDVDKNLKLNITKKVFFLESCDTLIFRGELKSLDRLLNSSFDDIQESTECKQNLAKERSFHTHCIKLIVDEKLPTLELLLNSFLANPEESAQFKRDLAKKPCFMERCEKLMLEYDFTALKRLLNVCLPEPEEMTKFKQELAQRNFFTNYCVNLITDDTKYLLLEGVLRFLFIQPEDSIRFKYELTTKDFFRNHCEKLMRDDQLQVLDDVLNSCLQNAEDVLKFKRDLFTSSKLMRYRCLNYYSSGNLAQINELVSRFLAPYSELIYEYKKDLLTSVNGLTRSIQLFDIRPEVIHRITTDGFLTAECAAELKKEIIFASGAIKIMQSWIQNGRVNLLKQSIDQFLESNEDKRALKKLLINDPVELIRDYFFKNIQSTWQSLLLWLLENENSVLEYKRSMPVDNIFDDLLKKCVFEKYDTQVRICRCRSTIDMEPLDRFLEWYFGDRHSIREYKLRRIDSFNSIDTIATLLRKSDASYLRSVMNWFFVNDRMGMDAFQAKNRGRKILRYLCKDKE
ncbi:uncharacterized protein LOC135843819 isoform X2 [Planococcus citri]|uniref:uncharacterized protein LOC135843819 isoform X2 n=1 Tax=Planococcus citri TaxID=170843 RepID=UPI0031F865D3